MITAFLGPRGTFSEEASLQHAGPDANLQAFSSFPALTAAVETGLADEAVLPIENSIEGSVSTTLDLLIHETPLKVASETMVPVRHFLITAPGTSLDEITEITSHPQAFGQCRKFLERCLPAAEQVAGLSTAGAVKEVSQGTDLHRAAIGTARAAELYGGSVLAHDIQDNHTNATRFVVLRHSDAAPTGNDKTSIGLTLKANVPGALFRILTPFAERKIQLTKIESRPTKAWLWEYVFLLDFLGHRLDEHVAAALEAISESCETLNIFGSYPAFPLESLEAMSRGDNPRIAKAQE